MKRIINALFVLFLCTATLCPGVLAETEERGQIRYGTPVSYGPTLTAAFTERSLTSYEDGRPITLVSVSGSTQAIVQVIDINAEKIIHKFYLDFSGYCYYGCVTQAGVIYFNVGNKVVQYDPAVKEPVLIGTAPTYMSGNIIGLVYDEEEQLLYGGVSHTGNLFRCNPKTKEIVTLATLSPECAQATAPDIIGDYVYVGGGNLGNDVKGTHVYKVDKHTGEKTALPDPTSQNIKSIQQIYAGGKYIFVKMMEEQTGEIVRIWDTAEEKWIDKTFNYKTSGMTDIHEGKYYYLWDDCFHSIDVETLETVDYPDLRYGSHLRGNGRFIEFDNPDFPGYSFLTAQYNGNVYILNTETNMMKRIDVMLEGIPLERRRTGVGCDDRVYIMAFKGTNGVAVNTQTGDIEYFAAEQGEGIVSNPETGRIYHGDYSGATIYEMDSSKPYTVSPGGADSDTNPKIIARIGDEQDRPFAMDIADNKLLVGTLPKAGTLGGALSIIDLETYQKDVYRNIIPDQAILSITHKDNIVYAATSVTGGSNSTPTAKTAHVFSFDLNTREIIKDVEIEIPGINGNIGAVHGLIIGSDGMLYGSAAGVYFKMNADTLELVGSNVYGTSFETSAGANAQFWHEYNMQFDPATGYLIVEGTIINPDTLEIVCEKPSGMGQFAGLDSAGNAYFVSNDTTLYKVSVIRGDDRSYLVSGQTFFRVGDNALYRNGNVREFSAYEENGRSMVPFRETAVAMGGTVSYDEETLTAELTNQRGQKLSFVLGDNKITIDGTQRKFGVRMRVIDGVSYIPLQTLCDFLGKDVYNESGVSFIYDIEEDFNVDAQTLDYILSEVYHNEA